MLHPVGHHLHDPLGNAHAGRVFFALRPAGRESGVGDPSTHALRGGGDRHEQDVAEFGGPIERRPFGGGEVPTGHLHELQSAPRRCLSGHTAIRPCPIHTQDARPQGPIATAHGVRTWAARARQRHLLSLTRSDRAVCKRLHRGGWPSAPGRLGRVCRVSCRPTVVPSPRSSAQGEASRPPETGAGRVPASQPPVFGAETGPLEIRHLRSFY